MSRAPAKKGTARSTERRKKLRSGSKAARSATVPRAPMNIEACKGCAKALSGKDRALFVEEEVGRIFCSEACIATYFSPEISRLEKEFFKKLSPSDLNGDERESYSHFRWVTL